MLPDDIWQAMYSGSLELMESGVTTTGDFLDNIRGPAWGDAAFQALEKTGISELCQFPRLDAKEWMMNTSLKKKRCVEESGGVKKQVWTPYLT